MKLQAAVRAGGFVTVPYVQEPGDRAAAVLGIAWGGPTMFAGLAGSVPTLSSTVFASMIPGVGTHVGA